MRKLFKWLFLTRWKTIRYSFPYPEGYGIYRRNRITGSITVLDRYNTREEALQACKQQNKEK
jgi:hypothetical protein